MNSTLNISLPENLKSYVNRRVRGGDFSNVSDYIRTLVRRDQEQTSNAQSTAPDAEKWSLIQKLASKRLHEHLDKPPVEPYASMDEEEVMQMVREEIKAYRRGE